MKAFRRIALAVVLAAALLTGGIVSGTFTRVAHAQNLSDVLLAGGIILAVSVFGDQIDNFINNLLSQREVELVGASKVVPIFSVGQGAYIGAAQVVGSPANVRIVQGVVAVEATISNLQGAALVPISTRTPGAQLNRVHGVGVSAVIDFRL